MGAALAVIWGTVGLVGPVAVLTNYQNQDIGQQLLTACQGFFEENKATLEGVSTYPNSPKHIMKALRRDYDRWFGKVSERARFAYTQVWP